MHEHRLPREEVGTFLRNQRCALLTMEAASGVRRMVVFSGYADRKYQFINLKPRFSFEPDTLSIAAASLKSRLDEAVTVWTLEECAPEAVDFIPLLTSSIENIHVLRKELAACPACVSPAEFSALDQQLFQPFMQDLLPLIKLTDDDMLIEEYQLMNYDYRHMLIRDADREITLRNKLPLTSAMLCLQYLQEDLLDRLYAHGAEDELIEAYIRIPRD